MKALILVDIQNDFLPGGNLPVSGGDAIIPVVNALIERFPLTALTQDWHPAGHLSFASAHAGKEPFEKIELDGLEQILWPDHCIQGSVGAAFPESVDTNAAVAIFRKGMDPRVDSYSAFFDNGRRRRTGLAEWLKGMDVDSVCVAGLAAEVCVAYTARNAAELGFATTVVEDGTRALSDDDFTRVREELSDLGVQFRKSTALPD